MTPRNSVALIHDDVVVPEFPVRDEERAPSQDEMCGPPCLKFRGKAAMEASEHLLHGAGWHDFMDLGPRR